MIFIATHLVIGEGLDATGVTTWAGQQLYARTGGSRTQLLTAILLLDDGIARERADVRRGRKGHRALARTLIDQYAISDGLVRTADSLFTDARRVPISSSWTLRISFGGALGRRAWTAIALLILMVALLATKALPEPVTGLVVASATIILRAVTLETKQCLGRRWSSWPR